MTHWFYHEPSQGRVGPIDADTLREHVRAGRVRRDTLVWRAGLSGWQPLREVEAELGLAETPPPLPPGADAAPATPADPVPDPAPAASPASASAASAPAPATTPAAAVTAHAAAPAAPSPQGRADFSAALDAADVPHAPQPAAAAPAPAAATGSPSPSPSSADPAPARSVSPADYAPAHVARRQQAAPPPKRGMSGCLIAVIVLAVLAIPVLGILAAIALPAYQDYTHRAKLSMALNQASVYKLQVAEYYAEHESCPTNTSPGFRPAAEYAGPQVAAVEFGRFKDSGQCAIQIELRGFDRPQLDGRKVWLSLQSGEAGLEWTCSSDVERAALLPQNCR